MKVSFIKFKLTLFFAIFVLSISMFANRLLMAKSNSFMTFDVSVNNLPPENVWTTNLYGLSKDVFQKVNHKRKLNNLKPLFWDYDLANLAKEYSKQMADENFFSHYDWEGNSVVERAKKFGIKDLQQIDEILFESERNVANTDIAIKSWLELETNRRKIYDETWTLTGIGTHKNKDGELLITQVFLKR